MSGVPKFVSPMLVEAAVVLVVGAVDAAAELARERREAAEAEARERSRQRLEELERLHQEGAARAEQAGRQREQDASDRRQRVLQILSEAGMTAPPPQADLSAVIERERRLSDLDARLAGLRADDLVMRWCPNEVAAAAAELQRLRTDSQSATSADAVLEQLSGLPRKARDAEEVEERRRYIASGIAESMREMGFVVSEPSLEYPGVAQSALLFEGVRASGAQVAVSVPVEGDVWYAVNGYPMRLEAATGGGEAATCDEAEREITAMHEVLKERFGVQMGPIGWQGKDPARLVRYADDLPTGHGADRAAGGGS